MVLYTLSMRSRLRVALKVCVCVCVYSNYKMNKLLKKIFKEEDGDENFRISRINKK